MGAAGSVRRNKPTSKATDAAIEAEVKLFLVGAKDRKGGRKKRESLYAAAPAAMDESQLSRRSVTEGDLSEGDLSEGDQLPRTAGGNSTGARRSLLPFPLLSLNGLLEEAAKNGRCFV